VHRWSGRFASSRVVRKIRRERRRRDQPQGRVLSPRTAAPGPILRKASSRLPGAGLPQQGPAGPSESADCAGRRRLPLSTAPSRRFGERRAAHARPGSRLEPPRPAFARDRSDACERGPSGGPVARSFRTEDDAARNTFLLRAKAWGFVSAAQEGPVSAPVDEIRGLGLGRVDEGGFAAEPAGCSGASDSVLEVGHLGSCGLELPRGSARAGVPRSWLVRPGKGTWWCCSSRPDPAAQMRERCASLTGLCC
jgi:hypothetical protein